MRPGLTYNSFLDPQSDFCSALYHKDTKNVDLSKLENAKNSLELSLRQLKLRLKVKEHFWAN